MCHYHGNIRGVPNSWAALSTCREGLSGVVFDGNELHYIEKATKNDSSGFEDVHYMYKHADLAEHNKTCGYSGDADHQHLDDDEDDLFDFAEEHKSNRMLRVSFFLLNYTIHTVHEKFTKITASCFMYFKINNVTKRIVCFLVQKISGATN